MFSQDCVHTIGLKKYSRCFKAKYYIKTFMYMRPMKSERNLVNNNFNYPCSNHNSYCLYLTCYYILYTLELHFLVKIHTAVLYTLFSFI